MTPDSAQIDLLLPIHVDAADVEAGFIVVKVGDVDATTCLASPFKLLEDARSHAHAMAMGDPGATFGVYLISRLFNAEVKQDD